MVKIESPNNIFELFSEIELLSAQKLSDRPKKVSVLKRKACGKIYESPRIVLSSRYKNFIGKEYRVYVGRARLTTKGPNGITLFKQEGDYILLFFPDKQGKKYEH